MFKPDKRWLCARVTGVVMLLLAVLPACQPEKKLTADFSASPRSGAAPLTVQFTDLSTQGSAAISAWLWHFGDGQTSTDQNPAHVYADPASYDVSLTVTSGNDSDQKSITGCITVLAGEGEGEGEGEGQLVPFGQSQAMIDQVTAQVMNQLPSSSLTDVVNGAAGYLHGQAIVTRAGVAETGAGVWAQLTDGTYYLIMVDPRPDAGAKALPVQHVDISPQAHSLPAGAGAKAGAVPEKPMVFLNLATDNATASERVQLFKSYASKYGYSDALGMTVAGDSPSPYGKVEWFGTLANYAVVYLNTKGMTFSKFSDHKAPWVTAMMTTDLRDITREVQDPSFLADMVAGRVFPGTVVTWLKGNDGQWYPFNIERYFVSGGYILAHGGQFDDGSLVYLDGGGFDTFNMAETFTTKNATMFVAWNAVPNAGSADTAARYLFSRAFGEQILDPPVPPNRPFLFDEALTGLGQKGLNESFDTYGDLAPLVSSATLNTTLSKDVDIVFRPTLTQMYLTPYSKKLIIPGKFGDKPGTVTIGGKSVPVAEWNGDDAVEVEIEDSDFGDVVVDVNGHKSQAVPLCQWNGTLLAIGNTYDVGPNVQVQCTAHFRGDLHKYHVIPDTDPFDANLSATFDPDSSGTVTFNGTFVVDKTQYKWDGWAKLDFSESATTLCMGTAVKAPDSGTITLGVNAGPYTVDVTITDLDTGQVRHEQRDAYADFGGDTAILPGGTISPCTVTDPITLLQVTVPDMVPEPEPDLNQIPG